MCTQLHTPDTDCHIIDDDGDDIAPIPDEDHRSVDPDDGIYVGLHNPIPVIADNPPPPEVGCI